LNGDFVGDIDLTVVTMVFDADTRTDAAGTLSAAISKYVVTARQVAHCRNIDLCASVTRPGRYVVIEKWDDADAQRAHFEGTATEELATACNGLLARPPEIDLLDAISAHDLH
jgi:quinol monooxygenase YgiN